jgi:nucleoside-diphosphate-sugar epimerase
MTFFITGASSFIGVELCRYLSDNGHSVIAMSRRENEHLEVIKKNRHLQVFRADMQSLFEKAKGLRADVFIHLAWAGTTHEDRNNPSIHEENVRLSLECVKLAKQMGCQLYVDAGSQAEYGIVPGILTENTPCNPVTAYGKGKLKMYKETCVLTEQLGLKYIHLRILSVYGENDHEETLIKTALKKLNANELIEMRSGGQKWNYIYVKDAVRQIAVLLSHAYGDDALKNEIYNIASNDTRNLQDFVMAMKEVCGSQSELKFGGYNPEKDVNLNPDIRKIKEIVKPLTEWSFEEVIEKISK